MQNCLTLETVGPGLVFVVYPEAIATMAGSTFWSLIFFFLLITLGELHNYIVRWGSVDGSEKGKILIGILIALFEYRTG